MASSDIRQQRKLNHLKPVFAEKGHYHSFDLPDGTRIEGVNPIERLNQRYARFPIPEDLTGSTVLDIGPWDGWFSFEAEKHGASVTAVDCVELPSFLERHAAHGSRVSYQILDFYEILSSGLGPFTYVFFLGVLYHLKHPLLALEIVCALTTETAIVESFVIDGETWREREDDMPLMEFYETTELGEQMDNWTGPSVGCLLAMCRAAGFARVEVLWTEGLNAMVACHRRWPTLTGLPNEIPVELHSVAHARNFGINFNSKREEYITWRFQWREGSSLSREDVWLEIEGFGVQACYLENHGPGWWLANSRLPPGLTRGWKAARMRTPHSEYSNAIEVAVDIPLECESLEIEWAADAATWRAGEWDSSKGSFVACSVRGLPANADLHTVRGFLGPQRLRTAAIMSQPDDLWQVNLELLQSQPEGTIPLTVCFAGVTSPGYPMRVISKLELPAPDRDPLPSKF